jgi:hypothetical protein
MDRLDELEAKLRKAKEELEKMGSMIGSDMMSAGGGEVNGAMGKKEDCEEAAEKEVKEHEKEKHSKEGHEKEHKEMEKAMPTEMIKYDKNGQWSITKSDYKVHGKEAKAKIDEHYSGDHKQVGQAGPVKEIDPKRLGKETAERTSKMKEAAAKMKKGDYEVHGKEAKAKIDEHYSGDHKQVGQAGPVKNIDPKTGKEIKKKLKKTAREEMAEYLEKKVRKPAYGSEELYEGNFREDAPPRKAKHRGSDPRHLSDGRTKDPTDSSRSFDWQNKKGAVTGGASMLTREKQLAKLKEKDKKKKK